MKPILFNTEMVRAILDGRKTVTRRVVKPQPEGHIALNPNEKSWARSWVEIVGGPDGHLRVIAPPVGIGDILYVRETFMRLDCSDCMVNAELETVCSRHPDKNGGCFVYRASDYVEEILWRPSIHMPKDAARLFLRVTAVRMERLVNITNEDILKEGVLPKAMRPNGCKCMWAFDGCMEMPCTNRESYLRLCHREPYVELWDGTIKPADRGCYGWAANPWVWVIEFERITKEEALT